MRPALVVLLVATAAAYAWDLSASGYANSFYAAAVQAGTKSWKAFFFGSLDASSFITVDKPPGSLWVMELSARVFGFGSWSMLVPQALEGVAAVALLYAAVKRWFGAGAGLIAGAVFAFTPVAALMFRFNNPDALLTLLLVAAAYCLTRALENASTKWMLAVGVMIGFAFLAKMMQAFVVLPGFALVYVVAAPTGFRRRIVQLLAGGVAVLVSAGWWVAIVALWPASSRPFIDGSPDNSILNLITGYNGFGRIFGQSGPGGAGGLGGGSAFSGSPGLLRLFNSIMGGQASWLLPAALLALAAGVWQRRRAPRTDRARAGLLLWGGWLLVTAAVFSFSQGIIHTYYEVALAPAIGALVAIGATLLWEHRDTLMARLLAAVAVAGSAGWAYVLLERTPAWEPWLRPLIIAAAALGAVGLLAAPALHRLARRATIAATLFGAVACATGPAAYAAQTITTAHTGPTTSAGPAVARGFGGGFRPGGPPAGLDIPGAGTARGGSPSNLFGGSAGGAPDLPPTGTPFRAGVGGFGDSGSQLSQALKTALQAHAADYRWVAATSGSQSAATIELATGDPVMAIGGFSGDGGQLTLAQFQRYLAKNEIHYYVGSAARFPGGGGFPGGGSLFGGAPASSLGGTNTISNWVKAHYRARTISGETIYDLTQPAA